MHSTTTCSTGEVKSIDSIFNVIMGLVAIGQEIKEKWRRHFCSPAYIITKYPSLNKVKIGKLFLGYPVDDQCFLFSLDKLYLYCGPVLISHTRLT